MATRPETQESAEEVRQRLAAHKADSGLPWSQIAAESGIANGTLTTFAGGTYAGNNERVAADVRRYLDGLTMRASLKRGQLKNPGYVETPTAKKLLAVMQWAHEGDIAAIACQPGTGKTEAALEYKTRAPNVWIATIEPTTCRLLPMLQTVAEAMGDRDTAGTPVQLSARIVSRARGARALLIVDEAQLLETQAIEQIRAWHDRVGLGVVFVGDYRVVGRLGGNQRDKLAQVSSRIAMRHVQAGPTAADREAVAHGWGITDLKCVRLLAEIGGKPGGLRSMVKVIKLAAMLAADEEREVSMADLQGAWAQLQSDRVALVA